MEDYADIGKRYPLDVRVAAARASIAITFGTRWDLPDRSIFYLAPACEKLDDFAGHEARAVVYDEHDLFSYGDEPVEGLVGPAMDALAKLFPLTELPHGRKYWLDVMRRAKNCAPGDLT